MSTISKRLDRLLGDRNATAVARELNLSPSTLSHYRRGRREPDPAVIERICRYFEVSADWLLGLTDDRRGVETEAESKGERAEDTWVWALEQLREHERRAARERRELERLREVLERQIPAETLKELRRQHYAESVEVGEEVWSSRVEYALEILPEKVRREVLMRLGTMDKGETDEGEAEGAEGTG